MPGYRKTTWMSAWIRQRGIRAGWVSLDRHDHDPDRVMPASEAFESDDSKASCALGSAID